MTTQTAVQSLIATPILDAIQKLNPVATDEQRAALEQSLREIGQVNDIITAHNGLFVLAACQAVGIEPRVRDLGELADDEMAAYAHHGNAMRKELPPGARALMAAVLIQLLGCRQRPKRSWVRIGAPPLHQRCTFSFRARRS